MQLNKSKLCACVAGLGMWGERKGKEREREINLIANWHPKCAVDSNIP